MTCLLVYYHSLPFQSFMFLNHEGDSCPFFHLSFSSLLSVFLPFLFLSLPFCLHPFPFVPRRRKIYVSSPFSDDFSRETLFPSPLSLSLSLSLYFHVYKMQLLDRVERKIEKWKEERNMTVHQTPVKTIHVKKGSRENLLFLERKIFWNLHWQRERKKEFSYWESESKIKNLEPTGSWKELFFDSKNRSTDFKNCFSIPRTVLLISRWKILSTDIQAEWNRKI